MDVKTARDKANQHIAQARAINDWYEGKSMPAATANEMKAHLDAAEAFHGYLTEPQHKHDMTGKSRLADITDGDGNAWSFAFSNDDEPGLSTKTVTSVAAFLRGSTDAKAALVEDSDGQKLLPSDFAGVIIKDLSRDSVIRSQATIRRTDRRTVDIGSVSVASASWGKLELGDTLADGMGSTAEDTITVWDLNALIKIGRDEMEDSDEGLVQMIQQAIVAKLAEQEDDAFAAGTGDTGKQPLGISKDTTITQGITATTEATVTADDMSNLTYAVPAWARRNGAYYANSDVEKAVSLLKDDYGRYLWQPITADGRPATFRGYRWYTVDGLPKPTATGTSPADKSVFFGDMKAGYMIADRRRFTVDILRERFLDEGKLGLLVTHRVGGLTIRPNALAWLKL